MQNKRVYFFLLVLIWATTVQAAVLTFHPTQPAVDTDDVYNLVGADRDRDNVGTSTADGAANDGQTYIAQDREGQGQTFMTHSNPGSYQLNSITVRHCGYTSANTQSTWYNIGSPSPLLVRLTDPMLVDTDSFVLASETYETTGSEANIFANNSTTNTVTGTGTWLTFTLDTPLVLSSDTEYGFDVTKTEGGQALFFELHGIKDTAVGGNPYPDGYAYSTGTTQLPGNDINARPGDRVFILDMTRIYSAWQPSPARNSVGVDTDTNLTLSWNTGLDEENLPNVNPNIKVHYLFGNFENSDSPTDPNLYLVATIPAGDPVETTASYLLQGAYAVKRDQLYKWQIVEGLDNGEGGIYGPTDPNNIAGAVWTFKTELSVPDIVSGSPADQLVFPNDPASFTVMATNPFTGDTSDLEYQWYKNGDIMSGEINPTLSFTAAQETDEAGYYCIVTLTTNNSTSQSRTASLKLKRLLAHWKLDNDPNDSSNGFDGVLMGDPVFTTGKINQALTFDGSNDYVEIPEGFNDFQSGLTISLWARPTAAGSAARFIDFGRGEADENIFFSRTGTTNTLEYDVYHMNVPGGTVEAEDALTLDEWQMFVVVHDPVTTIATIYKNGVEVASGGVAIPNNIVRTSNFIGESNWDADDLYAGQMDDIRIYNYPIEEDEIAALYAAGEGNFCRYPPVYDFTGDCRVKLDDFAILAQHWAECGFYPSCQ